MIKTWMPKVLLGKYCQDLLDIFHAMVTIAR
jgi:hypothetical protein